MTDQESPETPKSPLPPEISPNLLLSKLSSLIACLTEYTEIVEIIPPKIDDILENLEQIREFIDREYSNAFAQHQAVLDSIIEQFTFNVSSLSGSFQESNSLVANIQTLLEAQKTIQEEDHASLALLIGNVEKSSLSLHDAQNRLGEIIQGLPLELEKCINEIQVDAKQVFSEHIDQFQRLKEEWTVFQVRSIQTIENSEKIISEYHDSKIIYNDQFTQDKSQKNHLQKIIYGIDDLFESRLLITSVISSIVAAVVVFSLGVIAVKWFVPQENSTSIHRNDKNTNSKPVQKLKP